MNGEVEFLLVEDDPADEELTLEALREGNLANHVFVVRDGAAALDYLFREGGYADRPNSVPRVVLLDLKLPLIDGLEVLRRVKGDPELARVPVVVMTSSRREQDVVKSYDLGANAYLVKPVDFASFTDAVRQLGLFWLVLNVTPGRASEG